MELEAQVLARDLVLDLLPGVRRVQPRHLVLVLVRHQLEQVARGQLGEPGLPRRLGGLGRPHLLDRFAVALRIFAAFDTR